MRGNGAPTSPVCTRAQVMSLELLIQDVINDEFKEISGSDVLYEIAICITQLINHGPTPEMRGSISHHTGCQWLSDNCI